VAALAVSAAEMLEFGKVYMAQIVKNSKALAKALDQRGIPVLGAKRGYTQTHQVIADVRKFGGGLAVIIISHDNPPCLSECKPPPLLYAHPNFNSIPWARDSFPDQLTVTV
jgi:hypothetical protein